ncbi:aldehyde dehydrogenase family protein [Flavihumibacter sp. CACIAM 22H1]|uniref:aldehyde dehydrogenase family protein n=1 Tax=Flavihumibacter sp. CACIAM 22H1 TaxID=1812911 RepID=UPI0007A85F71|nr:aldehyde dehydrogenase family protein [Flavihumibacter sp. CACIAM 22H1]KYP13781.1 MAG: aldehyde dehydrogenase [Flavihumibacter sp. CACIAM 22H1]
MSTEITINALQTLRKQFENGVLAGYKERVQLLRQVRASILRNEEDIYAALQKDLHKCKEESWVTEIGMTISEIDHAIQHLKKWMRPKPVPTNLVNLPSASYIYPEPLGVVLVIGPWNYPFMLVMAPMIGALAAGNTVVIKPSEHAPATVQIIEKIIRESCTQQEVLFVSGDGATLVPELMQQFRFDHVFFTGGTRVGKKIYEMAAARLVPVTLELGGKSPCIVEEDASVEVAARRITLGKFSNAGQICIAPDYLLVHASIKDKLVKALKKNIRRFYGDNPQASAEYCRIINTAQFHRLKAYLDAVPILHGATTSEADLYIEPTLVAPLTTDTALMQEEIFGPILPVFSFHTMQEALEIIRLHPNPLAFYVFTSSKSKEEAWIRSVPAGTGCINNAAWQFTNPSLPFGGRGDSGIGSAHGKFSFDRFTHFKAVMKTPTWFDPALKYPPMKGKLGMYKKVI